MNDREQLLYLIEEYYKGKYSTEAFTDEFNRIYDLEIDYNLLTNKEHKLMKELSIITGRFSSSEEDLKISNAYFSEEDVKNKASEVYFQLCLVK